MERTEGLSLIGTVERLLAGAAVAGASVYVLLNALYIEFYDDFGVRPEDVGLDRLAVLGRSAWVALVAVVAAGLVSFVIAWLGWVAEARRRRALEDSAPRAKPGSSATSKSQEESRTSRRRMVVALTVSALLLYFVPFYWLLRDHVEDRANAVASGATVGGIGWVVPLLDVRATRAEATWLGDPQNRPESLEAEHLIYLGRSTDVVVLLSCGKTTLLLQPDDVLVELIAETDEAPSAQTLPDSCQG